MAVEGVVSGLLTPLALSEPWFGLLVPWVFNGVYAGSEDVLGEVPIHGQLNDGMRMEVTMGVGSG